MTCLHRKTLGLETFAQFQVTNNLDTTAPTVDSAATSDTTTIKLTLSEDVELSDSSANISANFTLSGDITNSLTVSSVSISENIVTLGLDNTLDDDDTISVAYAQGSDTIDDVSPQENPLETFAQFQVTNNLDTTAPTVDSAATSDTTTIKLTLSEDVELSDSSANISANFTLSGDITNSLTVSSVSVSENIVTLGLDNTLDDDDTISVAYAQGSDTIDDVSANSLASFGPISVTNNIADTTAPTIASASVTNATRITVTYDDSIDVTTTDGSGFTLSGQGATVTANTDPGGTGNSLILTVSGITTADVPNVIYTATAGTVVDDAANAAADQTFTGTTDDAPPTVDSAATSDTTTIKLTLSEDVELSDSSANISADFTLSGDITNSLTVSSVSVSENIVTLGLDNTLDDDDTISVAYAQGSDTIDDVSANSLASFGPISVTNNIADTTAPTIASASVTNATRITVTYDDSIDVTTTDGSGFTLSGQGATVTANTDPGGTGNSLILTVSGITTADVPNVIYTATAGTVVDDAANAAADQTFTGTTDDAPPTVDSAATSDTTTIKLTLSEDVELSDSSANISADFTLSGDITNSLTVSSVSVSENIVTLGLDNTLDDDDTISVAYAQGSDTIDDVSANSLASFGPISVTNNIADTTAPTIASASVTNATRITVTYDDSIDVTTTDGSGFTLSKGTVTANTDPGGTGNSLILTVSGITTADVPNVIYTATAGTVVDDAANAAADQTFTGTTDDAPPTVDSAATSDTTTIKLTLSEDVELSDSSANISADFTLSGDITNSLTVSSVSVSENIVTLGLDNTLDDDDTISVAYAQGSDTIDDVSANSLASFGPISVTNNLDTTAPTVDSAATSDTTTIKLTLSEDVELSDSSANISANFTLSGDITNSLTVSSVSVSENIVTLGLDNTLDDDDTISVAYAQGSDTIDDVSANSLASFGPISVTNNIADTTAPTIASASVTNATRITVTYDDSIDVTTTDGSGFTLSKGTVTANTDPGGTGNSLILTVSGITTADVPNVIYTATAGTVVDDAANAAADQTFTGTTDDAPPTVASAATSDTTTIKLTLSEDVELSDSSANISANFTLSGDITNSLTVSSVSVSENIVTLGLDNTLDDDDTISVAYAQGSDTIDDVSANSLASFGPISVTNNIADTTAPTIASASVTNATRITVTYDDSIDVTTTDGSGFTLSGQGATVTANTDPGGTGNSLILTVSGITTADVPNVIYTATAGTVVDDAANAAADQTFTGTTDDAPPTVASAATSDTTTIKLTLSEDVELSDSSANISADFTLSGEIGNSLTVSSVSVSENIVTLGLDNTLDDDDTISVAYAQGSDTIDDVSANSLASFGPISVTNNIADTTAPEIASASVTNATRITVAYDDSIDVTTTDGSGLTLSKGTVTANTDPGGTGNSLILTVSGITTADVPNVIYTATAGTVVDDAANAAADQTFTGTTDDAPPTVASAATSDTTTIKLTLSEDVELSDSSANISADFTLSGDITNSLTVSSVSVSENIVTLGLDNTLDDDDTISVAYAQGSDTIDDVSANSLASFGPISVTNNIADTTAPTIASASVTNATRITVAYDDSIDVTTTDGSGFTLSKGTVTANTDPGGTGNSLILTVSGITTADVPNVIYTATAGTVVDDAANAAADQTFTGTTDDAPPTVASAATSDTTTIKLTLSEDVELSDSSANISADFTLSGDITNSLTVSSVSVSENIVTLGLDNTLDDDDTISVAYAQGSDTIDDVSANSLASFGPISVTNNIADTTAPTIASASVTNATRITVAYDDSIDVTTTDGSGFTLSKGTVTANTDPGGTGNSLILTVSGITTADVPNVIYTATAGTVVDDAANAAADQTFTGTTDDAPPTVASAATSDTTTIKLTLSEDVELSDSSANISANFTLSGSTLANDPVSVDSVSVSADTVTLGLSGALDDGDTIYVSYTQGSDTIDDVSAQKNPLVSFAQFQVANNLDTTAPTVISILRENPTYEQTNDTTPTFKITFNEAVAGVTYDGSDFTTAVGAGAAGVDSIAVEQISNDVYHVTVTTTSDGTVNLDVDASNDIADIAGNPLTMLTPTGSDQTFTVDRDIVDTTAPTVISILRENPTYEQTNDTTPTFKITFNEAVAGVTYDGSDFTTAVGAGAAGVDSIAVEQISNDVYHVTVTTTSDGTVNLDVDASNDIADIAGNPLTMLTPTGSDQTFTVDRDIVDTTAPTVISILRENPTYEQTNDTTPTFKITFNEAVAGVTYDGSDFTTAVGAGAAGVDSIAVEQISNDVYHVTVTTTSDGTVNLDVDASNDIADIAGNPLTMLTPTGSDQTFTVDRDIVDTTAPTVISILRENPTYEQTNDTTPTFKITFNEAVAGVTYDGSDFTTAVGAGAAGVDSIAVEQISDDVYHVTVTTTSDGTVNLDVDASNDIADIAGNPLINPAPTGSDQTFTVDRDIVDTTAPTVISILRENPTYEQTNDTTPTFKITFNEAVAGVTYDGSDFTTAVGAGAAGVDSIAVEQISNDVYHVTVTTTSDGTVNLDVDASNDIADIAGNPLTMLTPTGSDQTFTVDRDIVDTTAPTVISILRENPTYEQTNDTTPTFKITFNEAVAGVTYDGSDFTTAVGAGAAGVDSIAVEQISDDVYHVTVTTTSDGTVNLDVDASNDIADIAGNPLINPAPTGSDQTFTVDRDIVDTTAPTVISILRENPTYEQTNDTTPTFKITFNEAVAGVTYDGSDFTTAVGAGAAGVDSIAVEQISDDVYHVTVTTTSDGTVNLDVDASNDIADIAGNPLTMLTPTGSDQTFTVDRDIVDTTAPTVISILRENPTYEQTNDTTPTFKITFNEAVAGVTYDGSDFTTAVGAGAAGVDSIAVEQISDDVYHVTVTTTSDGTVNLDVDASNDIADIAGNP